MPFPAERRIRLASAVLALVLAGFATVSLPASAAEAVTSSVTETVTGPADGAVIAGTAVVFSAPTADEGAGYELRWSTDPTVDAGSGRLAGIDGGGDTIVTMTDYALVDLAEQTYFWQVRSLDDGVGMWSVPRSFTIDPDGAGLQLDTYPLTDPTAPPAETPPPASAAPSTAIGGGVWVAGAVAFAVLFLAVVLLGAQRIRRAD